MRPVRVLARAAVATAAMLAATGIATVATAPAAHADGCVDDYLASGSYYVAPDIQSVDVTGGVVTIDTNAVVPDVKRVSAFERVVVSNESGKVVTLVTCIA
jgi:hypothetical protein